MSWSWHIYTEIPATELAAIETAYEAAMGDLPWEESEEDSAIAELVPGGSVPCPSEVEATRMRYGEHLEMAVLERLARCRLALELEHPLELADSPFQVTALRFLLERLAPCVIDWGDHAVELGEAAMTRLQRLRGCRPRRPPKKAQPVKRREALAGEMRAVRILRLIDAAQRGDVEAASDLAAIMSKTSAAGRAWLVLLTEEGPCSDRVAARRLGLDESELRDAAEEIERQLE